MRKSVSRYVFMATGADCYRKTISDLLLVFLVSTKGCIVEVEIYDFRREPPPGKCVHAANLDNYSIVLSLS